MRDPIQQTPSAELMLPAEFRPRRETQEERLSRLAFIVAGKGPLPAVYVSVSETHHNGASSDPAVETELRFNLEKNRIFHRDRSRRRCLDHHRRSL